MSYYSSVKPYRLRHSQNYIYNKKLSKRIINTCRLTSDDTVIEIGPGKGALTDEILKKVNSVYAVEKDVNNVEFLKSEYANNDRIKILCKDFFEYKLPQKGGYKVVSNIPFAHSAEIIRKLLNDRNPPKECYLIVQREFAERLSGKNKEGLFSLQFKPWFETKTLMDISKFNFKPVPSVDATLIVISKRDPPLINLSDRLSYLDFISFCFSRWEKTAADIFRELFTARQLSRFFSSLGLDRNISITNLTFSEWILIYNDYILLNPGRSDKLENSFSKYCLQQSELKKVYRTRR